MEKEDQNMIKHLEKETDFNEIVKQGNVVVDFFATWCGPCRMMGRVLEEIEKDYPAITFLKVDTDTFGQIAMAFGVSSIPTLIAYKDGKRVALMENGKPHGELLGSRQTDDFRLVLDDTFSN